MKRMHVLVIAVAGLVAGGCATSYDLTLMPRDSGKLYTGVIENAAGGESRVSITLEGKTYNGTSVQVTPDRTNTYVSGGFGWGGRRAGLGLGTVFTMDNPEGSVSTALLQSSDGSGLRCEFRSGGYGRGGGHCRDDRGREYDVQLRPKG